MEPIKPRRTGRLAATSILLAAVAIAFLLISIGVFPDDRAPFFIVAAISAVGAGVTGWRAVINVGDTIDAAYAYYLGD
jgi:hypothetical membrane protein